MNKREIDIYLPVDDESGIILTNIALLKKKIDYDEVDVFFRSGEKRYYICSGGFAFDLGSSAKAFLWNCRMNGFIIYRPKSAKNFCWNRSTIPRTFLRTFYLRGRNIRFFIISIAGRLMCNALKVNTL